MTTQEKENEDRLRVENTFLRSMIESFKDVLIFSIDKEYRYQVFNLAFQTATFQAYGVTVAPGMSLLDSITVEEDRNKAKQNLDRALAGENHLTEEVYGELVRLHFETRYNPIVNSQGEVVGVTVMSTNITERKRSEEQLQELNKEMESFSYSASHDLRTPLRAINGYAEILKEDYGQNLDPEAQKLIEAICRNVEKMGSLIDALLRYSRLGRKDLVISNVDMNAVVKGALWDVYQEDEHPHASLEIQRLLPVLGDTSLSKQVWVNLISNALKYSSKNPAPKIEIGCMENDQEVTYFIKDNGVGFDMQFYGKIFGVFQRLHSSDEFEGNGVGLAIAQRIVQRLGGKIWAESEVHQGASFFFSLPKSKVSVNAESK